MNVLLSVYWKIYIDVWPTNVTAGMLLQPVLPEPIVCTRIKVILGRFLFWIIPKSQVNLQPTRSFSTLKYVLCFLAGMNVKNASVLFIRDDSGALLILLPAFSSQLTVYIQLLTEAVHPYLK